MNEILPILIVISGPSAVGKSTLRSKLLQNHPELTYSISYTTRKPRPNEKDGVDYFFVSVEEFKKRILEDDFLEYALVYGNYYGTSKSQVEKVLRSKKPIVLEVDVQGAENIIKKYPDCCSIFIAPPSLDILIKRFSSRGTETDAEREKRINEAKNELLKQNIFKYVIVNDELEEAYKKLENAILEYQKQ
ncbi:MAG: guanylate kinase, partial [Spirochaetota bacterium]